MVATILREAFGTRMVEITFCLQKFSQGAEFSGYSLLLAAEDDFARRTYGSCRKEE
jgi:hypothetical protein